MNSKDTDYYVKLPIPLRGEDCVFVGIRIQGKDYGLFTKIDTKTITGDKLDEVFLNMSNSTKLTIDNKNNEL